MPGATVTLTNTGNGLVRVVVTDCERRVHRAVAADRQVHREGGALGLQDGDRCRTSTLGVDQRFRVNMRLEVGAVEESITVTGASPLVQTSSSELGTTVNQEQISTLPLNGRNFVNLTRTVPGVVRGIPGANIDGARQPRVARVGIVLGERPAAARQQLHARRRRQQRNVAADGGAVSERRRARRVQAADQHLLGGVRPVARRCGQPPDQVRHQRHARQRVRVPAQRRVRRQQLLQQPRRTRRSRRSASTSSAARSAGRSSRTRPSTSSTIRDTA